MAPVLAQQLLVTQQEFREAKAEYDQAKRRNNCALNRKHDPGILRMQRVEEEITSRQCLLLHNREQVHAVIELLEKLDHRGRLRLVEIKCREVEVAQEMQQALQEYGFKESYELPPARWRQTSSVRLYW